MRRSAIPGCGALLVAAATAAAGCSSGHHSPKARAATATTTTLAASTTTAAPPPASSTTSTGHAAATSSTSTTANPNASRVAGGCTVPQLTVSLLNNGVAAGSVIYQIGLHNKSSQACSLTGFPGIGLLDASGRLMPLNLTHSPQSTASTVHLAPGGDASFSFRFSDGTGYSNPSCPKAAKMEVTPPDDYGSLVLNAQPAPCAEQGQTPAASVTAVSAGQA